MFPGQQHLADVFDGVTLFAHFLHLFAGAVLGRVRHGMPAITIGLYLQNIRPLAGTAVRHGFFTGGLDRQHIHAIHGLARDTKGLAPLINFSRRGRAFLRRSHGVLVVFNHEHHRKRPKCCHIESFVNLALVGRAIAKIGERNTFVFKVLIRKCQARTQRDLCGHDAMPAIKMLFLAEHVHRAAFAL